MIDAIILDVDGTLWDTTGLAAEVWTRAAKTCGFEDKVITADQLKQLFGKPMDVIVNAIFPGVDQATADRIFTLCCEYEEEMLDNLKEDLTYEGVVDAIKNSDLPVAIVSNCQSGYIEQFMANTDTTDYVVDTECFGNTGEGKAENLRRIIARNGWEHPVYVGDTAGDLQACQDAGVPFIWCSYGFGQIDPRDAIGVADTFADVWDIIKYVEI